MKKEEEKKFKEVGEAYRYDTHTLDFGLCLSHYGLFTCWGGGWSWGGGGVGWREGLTSKCFSHCDVTDRWFQ